MIPALCFIFRVTTPAASSRVACRIYSDDNDGKHVGCI